MWLNVMYITPNFYRTTLKCDCDIGKILCYHKWDLIWRLILVCIIIIEHDFIAKFLVVVDYFIIFAGIIFINLCLIYLTY